MWARLADKPSCERATVQTSHMCREASTCRKPFQMQKTKDMAQMDKGVPALLQVHARR